MRQKRAKSYRKQMLVYNHSFKFREPYQVLVDNQIVLDTHKSSYDLVKGLKRTLQAEVKPMITQCCMQALYETGNQDAIEEAKTYERRRCNHPPKEPRPPLECIMSIVDVNGKNKHRYVVASQDLEIRRKLRSVPGVPLIYMNRSVMVMEPLSKASETVNKTQEHEKLFKGLNDPKYAGLSHDPESANSKTPALQKKKRQAKEPNPLSVRKKKAKTASSDSMKFVGSADENQEESDQSTLKRRKRKRSHKKTSDATVAVEESDA
ncbi:LAFE_0E00650g1_1 [Lachancea fermentati]|uniref:U three protein 23 n=1 Tax=Lachancea fermentati TaxID=4955 RepID=A0A1G4MC41_LACFM|nr:LAFE_0E00650g1_1 [Lachancea fermentati]